MIGVIDITVIITMDAVISKHIVEIDKHDINRLLFELFKLEILRMFGNILFV